MAVLALFDDIIDDLIFTPYEDLVQTVLNSSGNGHNACQPIRDNKATVNSQHLIYRDWSSWLLKFFKKLADITSYHHFKITKNKPGMVVLKKVIDGNETEVQLLKSDEPFGKNRSFRRPPKIFPKGLSLERQWYLYEQISMHIPNVQDRDVTCPKPSIPKPKK